MLDDHIDRPATTALVLKALNAALIGRVLDSDATGFIVPHVKSQSDAYDAVQAAHYPPFGKRGLATSTRAGRQTMRTVAEHIAASLRSTVVVGQIEDVEAVPLAGAISNTERLDCVWIGPNDLSQSLGKPRNSREFSQMEQQIAACVKGVPGTALAVLADSDEDARMWAQRGASVIVFSALGLIASEFTRLVDSMKQAAVPVPRISGA